MSPANQELLRLGGAAIAGLFGLVSLVRAAYFQFVAARATGRVAGSVRTEAGGARVARIDFQTADGRAVQFVGGRGTSFSRHVPGTEVEVRYPPSNPQRAVQWSAVVSWIRPVMYFGIAALVLLIR